MTMNNLGDDMNNEKKFDLTTMRIIELKGQDSQEVFAEKIHMSQANVSKMLNGTPPSASTLIALAKEYEVSVDWILGLSDRKSNKMIPSAENMTYNDAISVLNELLELGSIDINGWDTSSLYIKDRVLKYLMESRQKVVGLDVNLRRFWYKNTADHFAGLVITKWEDEFEERFDDELPENPNDSDVIRIIEDIYHENLESDFEE